SEGCQTQRRPQRCRRHRSPEDSPGRLGLGAGNRRRRRRAHRAATWLRRIPAGGTNLGGRRPALPGPPFMIRIPAIAAALVAATASAVCVAQSTRTPSVRWPGYTPNMFRWDEDYRFLRDQPGLALFPYRLKYIALSEDGARYASLGGEYRFRV